MPAHREVLSLLYVCICQPAKICHNVLIIFLVAHKTIC